LADLTEIDLSNTFRHKYGVTDAGLAQLKLGKLKRLNVTASNITDAGLRLLKDSAELSELWASECDISDDGLEQLKTLTRIYWLKLDRTKVTDAGLANLNGMTKLRWLSLNACKGVGDAGLVHLGGHKELLHLEVSSTAVTQEGGTKLQRKLPKCQITGTNWEIKGK
jgi:Leucine Rich repeat